MKVVVWYAIDICFMEDVVADYFLGRRHLWSVVLSVYAAAYD